MGRVGNAGRRVAMERTGRLVSPGAPASRALPVPPGRQGIPCRGPPGHPGRRGLKAREVQRARPAAWARPARLVLLARPVPPARRGQPTPKAPQARRASRAQPGRPARKPGWPGELARPSHPKPLPEYALPPQLAWRHGSRTDRRPAADGRRRGVVDRRRRLRGYRTGPSATSAVDGTAPSVLEDGDGDLLKVPPLSRRCES